MAMTFFKSAGATEMTMRDCDSLKSTVVAGVSAAFNEISAPNQPFGIEATFSERNAKSALGTIVRAFDKISLDQIANGVLHLNFVCEINLWRRTDLQSVAYFQITRAAQVVAGLAMPAC